MLKGFKIFNFNEGVPYISITRNGIRFSKGVVIKLNYPQYVTFLINKNSQQVALQVCDKKTHNATVFYKQKKTNVISIRWNSKDLLNTIESIMQWNLEIESYRIEGKLMKEENAIIFDLNKAKIII